MGRSEKPDEPAVLFITNGDERRSLVNFDRDSARRAAEVLRAVIR